MQNNNINKKNFLKTASMNLPTIQCPQLASDDLEQYNNSQTSNVTDSALHCSDKPKKSKIIKYRYHQYLNESKSTNFLNMATDCADNAHEFLNSSQDIIP
jgi:hypothetical protein